MFFFKTRGFWVDEEGASSAPSCCVLRDCELAYVTLNFCSLDRDWMYRTRIATIATQPIPTLHITATVSVQKTALVRSGGLTWLPGKSVKDDVVFSCQQCLEATKDDNGEENSKDFSSTVDE